MCSDWCYCVDNSVACVSVVFLEHCLGVSAIDQCDLCRLKCLNMPQDLIEVLLYYYPCFHMGFLDDILDQLDVKLASGVHLAIVQARAADSCNCI